MELSLFTLPVCLLPGGITKLRIFEPRYKRLVSESLTSGQGFALCMQGKHQAPLPIATRVDIVDFETLDDGLLGITIRGRDKIALHPWVTESDGLKRARAELLCNWPSRPLTTQYRPLAERLEQLLDDWPQQLAGSAENEFNDLTWVCSRWLEILPIGLSYKQRCYQEEDAGLTLSLLEEIFKNN